jgi:RNA polymerase sigma-70 factor (ECF subfamily)
VAGQVKIQINGDLLIMTGASQAEASRRKDEESLEASLVRAVRAGDREAFGRLYSMYAPMVHGILLARVPWAEVDDLVQDVFLVAFRKVRMLRDYNAFGGWIAMIARNRAHDFHRRSKKTEELPQDIAAESQTEAGTDAERILGTVQALPDAYRETLVLRLVEGMTGPEIAARTGLTPASVRVNLHRGMKLLRERLGMEGVL